ncbi:MAG: helix-hairpin-helix domain-containing protein [Psychrobium sp.]|nr:helix-hairpin-helix domain-containing protein [Psychrobium sp.]
MHVNINTATEKELVAALNGIGSKKAKAIVNYRKQHGKFKSNSDLLAVKGIGPKLLEKNNGRIKFSGNSKVDVAKKKGKSTKAKTNKLKSKKLSK